MSLKTASTEYPILDLLRERWSPRAFADKAIDPQSLRILFEAARWAPSSANEQPWSFVVAAKDDAEAFERVGAALNPGNSWAKKAAVLGLSVASLTFVNSGAPNRVASHDVGLALADLTVQATSMGIYVHQMGGFDVAKAREALDIPETHAPVAMFALGYLGDPSTLSEDLQKRETSVRQRKPQSQFVFAGRWGQSASF